MEFKRWPAFLALTFSVSFRALALAQELDDKPADAAVGSQNVTGTIVVEEGEKAAENPPEETPADQINRENGVKLFSKEHEFSDGIIRGNYYIDPGPVDPATLPKFVIGVSLTEVPDSLRAHIKLAEGAGIMVGAVVPESPATKAGLQQYDILLKAGDRDLKQPKDLQDLVDAAETKPLSLTLQRAGEQKMIDVTPIKREDLKFDTDSQEIKHMILWNQTAPPLQAHWTTLMGSDLDSVLLQNGVNSALKLTSEGVPAVSANPPQVEALTISIRALTEQIERLQRAVDRLEQKPGQRDEGARDD